MPALLSDALDETVEPLGTAGEDRDVSAHCRQTFGSGLADSAGSSGDDGDPAAQGLVGHGGSIHGTPSGMQERFSGSGTWARLSGAASKILQKRIPHLRTGEGPNPFPCG
ncbi:hypothetical protein GCM10017776_30080 [Streptomyces griseoluteus]|nr:hypothetical protein GCM10017776_30080 [Streptomyces griseoluteus]